MPFVPRICVSLMPDSPLQLKKWLPECREADLVELRLDRWSSETIREFFTAKNSGWQEARRLFPGEFIVTIRSVGQGGYWKEDNDLQTELLRLAIQSGADYVDVEWEEGVSPTSNNLQKFPQDKVILSHHAPEYIDPKHLLLEMCRLKPAVCKLVFPAQSIREAAIPVNLLNTFSRENRALIIHASGEAGSPSRLVGAVRGNAWTYVALSPSRATASGQLTLQEALEAYYLKEKSPNTRIVGLVGHPLRQSKGWKLHNRLMHQKREESEQDMSQTSDFLYLNFPTRDFAEFWDAWQSHLFGLSVTIPFKEEAIRYASRHSAAVTKSGVCNTLIQRNGEWWAFNTDFLALLELLSPYRKQLQQGLIVVGTGATARTALTVARELEIEPLYLVGRNENRLEKLSKLSGAIPYHFSRLPSLSVGGMVQTTPLGMWPDTETAPPVFHLFRKGMVVLDVVYNPPETQLLKRAREAGCLTISGQEMFIRQAAHQFRMFSGRDVTHQEVARVYQHILQEGEE